MQDNFPTLHSSPVPTSRRLRSSQVQTKWHRNGPSVASALAGWLALRNCSFPKYPLKPFKPRAHWHWSWGTAKWEHALYSQGGPTSQINTGLWSKGVKSFYKENYIERNFLILKTSFMFSSKFRHVPFYVWEYTLHKQMPYFWKSKRKLSLFLRNWTKNELSVRDDWGLWGNIYLEEAGTMQKKKCFCSWTMLDLFFSV